MPHRNQPQKVNQSDDSCRATPATSKIQSKPHSQKAYSSTCNIPLENTRTTRFGAKIRQFEVR
jgi:hypothetical protein